MDFNYFPFLDDGRRTSGVAGMSTNGTPFRLTFHYACGSTPKLQNIVRGTCLLRPCSPNLQNAAAEFHLLYTIYCPYAVGHALQQPATYASTPETTQSKCMFFYPDIEVILKLVWLCLFNLRHFKLWAQQPGDPVNGLVAADRLTNLMLYYSNLSTFTLLS